MGLPDVLQDRHPDGPRQPNFFPKLGQASRAARHEAAETSTELGLHLVPLVGNRTVPSGHRLVIQLDVVAYNEIVYVSSQTDNVCMLICV